MFNTKVFWLDYNCNNQDKDNENFFDMLQDIVLTSKRFDNFQAFQNDLALIGDEYLPSGEPLYETIVVCSSTLEPEIYEKLNKNKKITMMIVYCKIFERGLSLQEKYGKIKEVFVQQSYLIDFLMNYIISKSP